MTASQQLSQRTAPVDSSYAWVRLVAAMLLTTVGCAGMYICMVSVTAYQADFEISRGLASLPFTMVMGLMCEWGEGRGESALVS